MAVAQTGSATVSGTVIDASGARVPNATVVAQSLETSAQRQTTTSSSGVYSLTALAVGHYRLTISAPGFQTFEVNNTQLQVGQNLTVDAQMQPASSATTVEVADTAPPLDETSADVGGVVSAEQVRQLPINGRSWASLETQTPGAIDSGTDNQRSIRFAGHGLDDNNYRFDGVDATGIINQAQKGNFRLQFSTEAVAEFRADAAVYTAENGGTQGGQVNVVSRSGTNDLHGSLFEYFRNSYFDARGPFDVTTLPFRLNQFGGSLGGPIRKDKDFFFVTFEGLRQRISQTLIGYVPSASFRAAVLQTSPALSQVINAYPSSSIPTGDPNVSQYIGAGRQVQNENFGLARYDHKFSDTNTLSVRYNIDNGYLNVPNGVLRDTVTTTLITQNAAITLDTVLSARTVNEFKVGFNRPNYQTHNQSVIDGQITTPQFSTLYNGTGKVQVGNSFNYLDTLTSVHGKHTIKAGAEIRRVQLNATATSSNDYEFTFSSTNNFLHDVLSQASLVNTLPTTGLRRTEYYGYVQDEIRATQTLTLNLGLRYELYGVPYEVKGRGIVFDPLTCPGGYCPPGYSFYKEDWHNFAPRVSFAWAPAAAGNKTVIRAGYGIYYGEGQIGDLTAPLDNLAGRALLTPQSYPALSYPVNPVLATTAFSFPSPRSLSRDHVTPYTNEWTFSVQQALTGKTVLTVGYLGESGAHQFTRTYLNVADPITHIRPYPQFGLIDYKATRSNNNFNGLQAQLERNLTGALQAGVNYMWSHAINDGSTGGGETDYPENVNCRACERGSSDLDIRHYFSGNLIYQLPFGRGRKFLNNSGWATAVFGGWEWANILTARTGLPVNVTLAAGYTAPDLNNSSPQRPNVVPGVSIIPVNRSISNWINPAAFSLPLPGTFGDAGRNLVRGPGEWQLDTALVKDIPLTERFRFVIRGEAFNVFNHPEYGQSAANFSNPTSFGKITSELNATGIGTGTPRVLEFALRLQF